jgi:hypothetical protein
VHVRLRWVREGNGRCVRIRRWSSGGRARSEHCISFHSGKHPRAFSGHLPENQKYVVKIEEMQMVVSSCRVVSHVVMEGHLMTTLFD